MVKVAGIVSELHGVIRDKIHEISKGDDAEAAAMASQWFARVEETNFEDVNFNEDIYQKMISKKAIPATMTYFTFRNHFIRKVLVPLREAILEFLQKKDSSLKRDQKELDWLNGFLNNYVTIASADRTTAALKKIISDKQRELSCAMEFALGFFQ